MLTAIIIILILFGLGRDLHLISGRYYSATVPRPWSMVAWLHENPFAAVIAAVVLGGLLVDIPIVATGYHSLSQDYWSAQHAEPMIGFATAIAGSLLALGARDCWWACFVDGLAVAHLAAGGPWN